MPFIAGQSGNPAGRPKGSHNKTDTEVREFLRNKSAEYFFGTGANTFQSDINAVKPGLRLQIWEKFLKYYLPQLAALAIDANVDNTGIIKIDFGFNDPTVDDAMKGIIDNI